MKNKKKGINEFKFSGLMKDSAIQSTNKEGIGIENEKKIDQEQQQQIIRTVTEENR